MRKSRLFFAAALLLAFATSAPAQEEASAPAEGDELAQAQGDAAAGKTKATACGACHGANGNSNNPQWPSLAGQHEDYLYHQLKYFKNGTRNNAVMAGQVANLSDQDMRDLAAYYSTLTMSVGEASKEALDPGQSIYRGGLPADNVPACAACHGPAGYGVQGAQYPHIGGQQAVYLANTLKAYRSGERGDYDNAQIMNMIAEKLSDEQIQALSSYISGLYAKELTPEQDQ